MKRVKRETLAKTVAIIKEEKRDVLKELACFKDYSMHKWAYNYVFPEYFVA